MRVSKIRLSNYMGVQELSIRPGKLTVIAGKNGSGKSSVLSAIRNALGGKGHDATLIRNGSKQADVILDLDDGIEVRERITAEDTKRSVQGRDIGKISKPKTYLDKLSDALSLNPIDLLLANDKERLRLVLQAMPLKVSAVA